MTGANAVSYTHRDEDVDAVAQLLGRGKVLHTEHFGRQKGAALRVPVAQAEEAVRQAGRDVDVTPVNLQKAFVYLVGEKEGARDAEKHAV